MLYRTIYIWVKSALLIFFSKMTIHSLANIPDNQPILLAANHQNALLDAFVVAACLKKPVHFMTRADIFKKKIIAKILRSLNLIPIYRLRDGASELANNEQIFDECNQLLSENKIILIFSEGSHLYQRRLRPLKKGVSRMAVGAVLAIKKEVLVIPIGVNYGSHKHSCLWLDISVGKPIYTQQLLEENDQNSTRTTHQLTEILSNGLKECIVNAEDQDNYNAINSLLKINLKHSNHKNYLIQQEWVKKFNEMDDFTKKELINKTNEYLKTWNKLALPLRQIGNINSKISIIEIVILPFYLLANLLFTPTKLGYNLLIRNFKDRQWEASMKVVSIMTFYPIWTICILISLLLIFPKHIILSILALFTLTGILKYSKISAEKTLFRYKVRTAKYENEMFQLKRLEKELQQVNIL